MNSLAMITKAGVQARKIVVGVTTYGRSFKMAEKGCHGPMCKFLGTADHSPAEKGPCTNTAGYIANAELEYIQHIADGGSEDTGMDYNITKKYHDEDSDSDILVYNDVQWVGYMTWLTKIRRMAFYASKNFGGSTEWAIDLSKDYGSNGNDDASVSFQECDLGKRYTTMAALEEDQGSMPPYCRNFYIINVLVQLLQAARAKFQDANNGYDEKFDYYVKYYHDLVPLQIEKW